MNNIKKVLSAWMLVACVLPVAAQYPVIPDSVKARGAKQEAPCRTFPDTYLLLLFE